MRRYMAIAACCHLAVGVNGALVRSDIVSTLSFANGTVVDASPLVRMALAGAPEGQAFSRSYALGRSGTFLYHPKATDGGDTACQGAVNIDQIGLLATPDLQPVSRNWLLLAVVRQAALSNPGQVWSQPGGPYHGFGQGAMEANAEFIIMASTYAAQTADRVLFTTAPERLVCALQGAGWRYVGTGAWNGSVCLTAPAVLLKSNVQLYADTASAPHKTVPRGKSKPGLYPGQGKIVVSRVSLTEMARALSIALTSGSYGLLNATVCVRDVKADKVVATTQLSPNGAPATGWVIIEAPDDPSTVEVDGFAPGLYDVAVQASAGDVAWISDSQPRRTGGARTEVYDEGEAPRGCCAKHAFNFTLSSKLEQALQWQLKLSQRTDGRFGMFVTADGRFNGVPKRASGITSSSAMWDQVRMGWKAAYPSLRVLGSLVSWRELAAAGLVSTMAVTEEVVMQVREDIVAQLGQPDGTLLTWRSCEKQTGPPTPPSNLPSSSCDRDDPTAPGQRSFDLGFVPDHALAVKLGVIQREVLLKMMPQIRHKSGHRLAVKRFEDQYMGGFIMVDSEKWSLVDDHGFAQPSKEQTGWSQVFPPPRTDGPGNYNNHEQNGGRLFSVSKMVLESTLYPQAVDDWADQVRGAAGIAMALLQPVGLDEEPSLPFPQLVRTPMSPGSLAQAYCKVAYGPSGKKVDKFGKNACDYYGDMTWGLRDGQLGPTLELLKALLGFKSSADGTLRLHGNVTITSGELEKCSTQSPCEVGVDLAPDVTMTWPAGVARVVLGGLNIGVHRNCSIDGRIQENPAVPATVQTNTAVGAQLNVSISYTITV